MPPPLPPPPPTPQGGEERKGRRRAWVVDTKDASAARWNDVYPVHNAAIFGGVADLLLCQHAHAGSLGLDEEGWSPLHYAAWNGTLSALRTLLSNPNLDSNIRTRDRGSTALHLAAGMAYLEAVLMLVKIPGLCTVKDLDGFTPLDVVRQIRSDPTFANKHGRVTDSAWNQIESALQARGNRF